MKNVRYQRQDATLLPEDRELQDILDREQDRPVPPAKMDQHYFDDSTIRNLIQALGLSTAVFDDDLTIFEVVRRGQDLLNQLVDAILGQPLEVAIKSKLEACFAYLSEEDAPIKSDLIFVFGTKALFRAERAAELYNQELAPQILVSGSRPNYESEGRSEASRYQEYLIQNGVPESAIIMEDQAITMPDNVRRSLNLLDRIGIHPQSIMLVNSPFAQRRGWAIMMKHIEDGAKICRVNSGTGPSLSSAEWYKAEPSLRIVLNEFIKLRASVVYNTV